MRPDPHDEAGRWLEQARRDLAAARYNAEGGYHNVACYLAQQAGEKALKIPADAFGAADSASAIGDAEAVVRASATAVERPASPDA